MQIKKSVHHITKLLLTNDRSYRLVCAAMLCGFFAGCSAFQAPLAVVDHVELGRFTGRWYEIARYPHSFEQGCTGVTADYALRQDGRISVLNTCREGSLDGNVRTIEGTARVVDRETNAKLAVTFFWPFEGPYWILELGTDYDYAVIGEPGRGFLWILSREPFLEDALFADILTRLPALGYDPDRLEMVIQPETAEALEGSGSE